MSLKNRLSKLESKAGINEPQTSVWCVDEDGFEIDLDEHGNEIRTGRHQRDAPPRTQFVEGVCLPFVLGVRRKNDS